MSYHEPHVHGVNLNMLMEAEDFLSGRQRAPLCEPPVIDTTVFEHPDMDGGHLTDEGERLLSMDPEGSILDEILPLPLNTDDYDRICRAARKRRR